MQSLSYILIGTELTAHFEDIKEAKFPDSMVFLVEHDTKKETKKNTFSFFDIQSASYSSNEPSLKFKIKAKDANLYIYTSGTSGLPKASIISHGRWIKRIQSAFGLTSIRLKKMIFYMCLAFFSCSNGSLLDLCSCRWFSHCH
ncbi:MAG: AMP-binding protein [Saprospirales bacterium]|nr:AMP-binding protein [Saprospirales bacterium]